MKSEKIPRYNVFRIFILSFIMLYMLVGPISSYLMMKKLPDMIASGEIDKSIIKVDSSGNVNFKGLDSAMAVKRKGEAYLNSGGTDVSISVGGEKDAEIIIEPNVSLLLYVLLIGMIIAYNIPFKRYFNKKRKEKEISQKLSDYVKRYLLYTPFVNSAFIFLFFLIGIIKSIIFILGYHDHGSAEAGLHLNLLAISLISSVLITLFGYFWFRHLVRYKYIEYVYSGEEIGNKLKKIFEPRLKHQLYFMHGITSLLPISVILIYLFISLSTPSEIGVENLSPEQIKILIGKYSDLVPETMLSDGSLSFLTNTIYINSFDAFMASVGILTSFIVSLFYVIFMTRWFTVQITKPMNSLLVRMELASVNKDYSHSYIRTNDELGKLTEGYNIMSDKIKNYIEKIEEMNRDLELKVIERTLEIQNQKNEIEAQRDEIEAQRDEIQAQRDTVVKQKEHIEEIHEEQTSSIRYSKRIQQAILPSFDILEKNYIGHFVIYKPRDIVSGDFYYFEQVNNTIIIAIADCTGHGVPGAIMSMLGITYLKEIVLKEKTMRPDMILNSLRNEIVSSLKQEAGSSQRDGMDIALCSINLDTLELQFSGANNPLYIVKNAASPSPLTVDPTESEANSQQPIANSQLSEVKGDKMPIGMHERMDGFTLHTQQLNKGDCIYMFSDGLADQFGGPSGKKFKYNKLKQVISENSNKPMDIQKVIIEKYFNEWKKDFEQVDDITLIGIRI